jgi:hypothetical protein
MVTKMLLARVRKARDALSVTPAREHRRRLKHALAMLRQRRPAIYARMLERTKPTSCTTCARPVDASLQLNFWVWRCAWCGTSDRTICTLAPDPGPMARLRAIMRS